MSDKIPPTTFVEMHDRWLAAEAKLAEAEDTIERAGRCLAMSNNGAADALRILRDWKYPPDKGDSAPAPEAHPVADDEVD